VKVRVSGYAQIFLENGIKSQQQTENLSFLDKSANESSRIALPKDVDLCLLKLVAWRCSID
jgi:hypothetical protein